jgi:hypothetical protein
MTMRYQHHLLYQRTRQLHNRSIINTLSSSSSSSTFLSSSYAGLANWYVPLVMDYISSSREVMTYMNVCRSWRHVLNGSVSIMDQLWRTMYRRHMAFMHSPPPTRVTVTISPKKQRALNKNTDTTGQPMNWRHRVIASLITESNWRTGSVMYERNDACYPARLGSAPTRIKLLTLPRVERNNQHTNTSSANHDDHLKKQKQYQLDRHERYHDFVLTSSDNWHTPCGVLFHFYSPQAVIKSLELGFSSPWHIHSRLAATLSANGYIRVWDLRPTKTSHDFDDDKGGPLNQQQQQQHDKSIMNGNDGNGSSSKLDASNNVKSDFMDATESGWVPPLVLRLMSKLDDLGDPCGVYHLTVNASSKQLVIMSRVNGLERVDLESGEADLTWQSIGQMTDLCYRPLPYLSSLNNDNSGTDSASCGNVVVGVKHKKALRMIDFRVSLDDQLSGLNRLPGEGEYIDWTDNVNWCDDYRITCRTSHGTSVYDTRVSLESDQPLFTLDERDTIRSVISNGQRMIRLCDTQAHHTGTQYGNDIVQQVRSYDWITGHDMILVNPLMNHDGTPSVSTMNTNKTVITCMDMDDHRLLLCDGDRLRMLYFSL